MRRVLIFALALLLLMIFSTPVEAAPTLFNLSVSPSQAWLDEDIEVRADCTDSVSIERVYMDITGPIIISGLNLTLDGTSYKRTISQSYFSAGSYIGDYNANIHCVNSNSETTSSSIQFSVSKFSAKIKEWPLQVFFNDEIGVYMQVLKNGQEITSGVSFDVFLGGSDVTVKQDPPPLVPGKGWFFSFDAPSSEGTQEIKVVTKYDRVYAEDSQYVMIKKPVQFSIVGISSSELFPKDNITVEIEAKERGNPLNVTSSMISFSLNSTGLNIISIARKGNNTEIKIQLPDISPGRYDLKSNFNYGGYSFSTSNAIEVIIPVSGKTVDLFSGEGQFASMKFTNDFGTKTVVADNSGSYSGKIVPGIYDLEIGFTTSNVKIKNINIASFNDPIAYGRLRDHGISGFDVVEIHSYDFDLVFQNAELEMTYDKSRVSNTNDLKAFRCDSWSINSKSCTGSWSEIDATIDSVRGRINVKTDKVSTFLIGKERKALADFSSDKKIYIVGEKIKVEGIAKDDGSRVVEGADIKVSLVMNNNVLSTEYGKSDPTGIFNVEITAPDREGNAELKVSVIKPPYREEERSLAIKLIKTKALSVVMDDSLKLEPGSSRSFSILVKNSGQVDLNDVALSISGIPVDYYSLSQTRIGVLGAGQEIKIDGSLTIPLEAPKQSYVGEVSVKSGDTSDEQSFALTVYTLNRTEESSSNTTGGIPVAGFLTFPALPAIALPPISTMDIIVIGAIGVFAITFAVMMKRRKVGGRFDRSFLRYILTAASEINNPANNVNEEMVTKIKVSEDKKRKGS